MTDEELGDHLPDLRKRFTDQFGDAITSGAYDERDLQRLHAEDAYALCFLRHTKGVLEKAVSLVDTSLKWRKEIGLNDLDEQYFPRWIHESGGVFYHNVDKDGHKILYFQVKKVQKDPEKLPIGKKFVAWWIEKHCSKHPGERIVVLFDMTDAGFGNMDMELIKFQISCFTTFFPSSLAYMLIYEMPWVLNTLWKVIKTILSAEQQKAVIFVKKPEIPKYIDKDQLWEHMGGTDTYQYTYLPSEDSGIEIPNGDAVQSLDANSTPNSLRKKVTFAEKDQTMYTSFDAAEPEAEAENSEKLEEDSSSTQPKKKPKSLKIPKKSKDVTSQTFVGTLATICPGEQFIFSVSDESKETPDLLVLGNTSDRTTAFKVKTTTPESYRVRPSTGIIQPHSTVEIQIFLQPGHTNVVRDKFLVMVMDIGDEGAASAQRLNELWKAAPREPGKYMEHRLWCSRSVQPLASPTLLLNQHPTKTEEQYAQLHRQFPYPQYPYMGLPAWPYPSSYPQPAFTLPPPMPLPAGSGDSSKPESGMEQILENQQRLEQRLSRIFTFQVLVLLLFLLLVVAVGILYMVSLSRQPSHNQSDSSCTPYYWQDS